MVVTISTESETCRDGSGKHAKYTNNFMDSITAPHIVTHNHPYINNIAAVLDISANDLSVVYKSTATV